MGAAAESQGNFLVLLAELAIACLVIVILLLGEGK